MTNTALCSDRPLAISAAAQQGSASPGVTRSLNFLSEPIEPRSRAVFASSDKELTLQRAFGKNCDVVQDAAKCHASTEVSVVMQNSCCLSLARE